MNSGSFRFLHAADIHLDSPLRGLSRYEGISAESVRTATREALDNLVDFAIAEGVAFVVIAGDLYDGDWEDFGTGLYFCRAMGRLGAASIDVFLLYGNHDADSSITKKLPLPPNVHVFPHRAPATLVHSATGTLLHGQSYKDRDPGGNLALGYPAATGGRFNVGVLHTCLQGDPNHAPYSPCDPTELEAKGYQYWALGHVHGFTVVREHPHIVFPGNLQGRNVRETGPKGAALITVSADGGLSVEHVPLDAVRWAHVEVDASTCATTVDVEAEVRAVLMRARDQLAEGRPLVVRVDITGASEAHNSLVGRREALREDVRAIAAGLSDRIWIEKVRLRSSTLSSASTIIAGDDVSVLLLEALADGDLQQTLRADFGDFTARLPADLGSESPVIDALRAGECESILAVAAESLRVRLTGASN